MAIPPRLFPGDEELGKRDDDHKPGTKPPISAIWQSAILGHHRRLPLRKNIRKIAISFVVLLLLYFFFKNIPKGVKNETGRPSYTHSTADGAKKTWSKAATGSNSGGQPEKPPSHPAYNTADPTELSKHYFDGPIKFYHLAAALRAIYSTKGMTNHNRNILFAASSLKSASLLLPMACEMSSYGRNHVHFAFMGRDDTPMDTLMEINGITQDCGVWKHDARPDYSVQSTDFRMEVSSSAAMSHINNFMHPQAVIVDNSGEEEKFFLKAMKDRTKELGKTLIELPDRAEQRLKWLNRLDSSSLKAWNSFSVDIVIHAQPTASGSLMRLLLSLYKADYFASGAPRLTIELPHSIDETTRHFLSDRFKWPPTSDLKEPTASQVILRHRIARSGLTPDESSVRFLESFWPSNPDKAHVLILSPQTELSPLYFHFLKYTILEYRYSEAVLTSRHNLLGISLDLPATYLNDTATFQPPISPQHTDETIPGAACLFLWQAPNSNAALYFGDKWTELHSFISGYQASYRNGPTATTLNTKIVAKTYPSWLEQILHLARIRGYRMLYPVLDGVDGPSLAIVHNELYHPPEEFSAEFGLNKEDEHFDPNTDDFTADPAKHLSLQHTETPIASTSLLNLLPQNKILPDMNDMPLLSFDGNSINDTEIMNQATAFRNIYAREFGRCKDPETRIRVEGSADDVFCYDDAVGGNEVGGQLKAATPTNPKVQDLITPTSTMKETGMETDLPVKLENPRSDD